MVQVVRKREGMDQERTKKKMVGQGGKHLNWNLARQKRTEWAKWVKRENLGQVGLNLN